MDPNFLLKDELEFELACRGIHDVRTCAPMRKILREVLSQETTGASSFKLIAPQSCLENPIAEIVTCETKCHALDIALQEIRENPDRANLRRIHTRLVHLSHRIGYVFPIEDIHVARHTVVRQTIQKLLDTINSLRNVEEIEGQEEISDRHKEILQKSLGEDAFKIIERIESGSLDLANKSTATTSSNGAAPETHSQVINHNPNREVSFQANPPIPNRREIFTRASTLDIERPRSKLVPVKDWGVKFNGRGNTSINAFLERINELKDARNAEDADLFRYAIDLFEDDALIWFRANRDGVHTWNELVNLLLVTFQKPFYQDELLDEIRKRTQGTHEKICIFIATMQNMFNRLPVKLTEQQKLSILRRNLHPYFQQAICRDNFSTVSELITVLRMIEQTKENCDNFREPELHSRHLEPDLAFQGNYNALNAINQCSNADRMNSQHLEPNLAYQGNYNSLNAIQKTNNHSVPNDSMPSKCWNCRSLGHRFRDCQLPQQRMFCYRCGKFGETTKKCPCTGRSGFSGNAQAEDVPPRRLP